MFKEIDEIYNYIGQEMYERLPEHWDVAFLEVNMDKVDIAISIGANYIFNNASKSFDLDEKNGVVSFSDIDEAFYALYKIMQKDENDIPWNKARFEMTSEGDFSIDFKYDEDFAYLGSLDPAKDTYPSSDEILAIESWEGLPESYLRYWAKTLLVLPNVHTLTRADVSAFTLKYNNSALFKERWKDNYSDNAMQLWEDIKQTYKNKAEKKYSIDELILALNYDFAVMLYQSDDGDGLDFYKWIFSKISKLT